MKLKILHVIPNLLKGGAERLVIDILRELSKRAGIEARLVIFRDEIAYEIEDIKHLVHILPSNVELSLFRKNKYEITNLQLFLENFQPDIIHSHLFEAEIVSRTCFYPKGKWFSHAHDNMKQLSIKNKRLKERITQQFEKYYLTKRYEINGGNHFIVISKHSKVFFEKNIQKFPIHLLPNAINFNKFDNSKSDREEKQTIKLISVGSLTPLKNHKFLVEIAAILKEKNIDFQLTVLGDGPQKNELKELVNSKSLNSEVFFLGNQDNVEDFLWQSTIYVHSSISEALGLTLLEAMASGLPVITLDGGGNRDLIEEGKNGYLLEERDPEIFADSIINLFSDSNKYSKMSQFAREYAKQYDINLYVQKLLILYQDAIDSQEVQ
jgi:glycosyltransferase involved in cell wall biosynthesis